MTVTCEDCKKEFEAKNLETQFGNQMYKKYSCPYCGYIGLVKINEREIKKNVFIQKEN